MLQCNIKIISIPSRFFKNKDKMQHLKKYYLKPDINKSGFAAECGTSTQFIGRVLAGDQEFSEKKKKKIISKLKADIVDIQNVIDELS